MSVPALSSINVYIPTNAAQQFLEATSPTHLISFDAAKVNADESAEVDFYILDVPFGKIIPNDVYGLQEDFNFFDNRLWNTKKLNTAHPTTNNLIDNTLGNRVIGCPFLFHNTSTASQNLRIRVSHSLGFSVVFDSTVSPGRYKYNIAITSDGLGKVDANGVGVYDLDGPDSTFLQFPSTSCNKDVVLINDYNVANPTANIVGPRSDISVPYSQTPFFYGEITEIEPTYIIVDSAMTDIEAALIKAIYINNQKLRILPLGKMQDDGADGASNIQFNVSTSQYGIKSWNYEYTHTQNMPNGRVDNIAITLAANEMYMIHIGLVKEQESSDFANGFSVGLELV